MIDLYKGDCLDRLKDIKDSSMDLVMTSPPYNFNMDYSSYEDNHKWEDYFSWLKSIWEECYRVLKDDGRLIVNIQPLFSDYVPTHHIISQGIMECGFHWRNEILWEKNNYNCKYCSWGSWKSPSMPYMKYTWEFIEVFYKKEMKHIGRPEDIDISADEFKQWVVAKWSIAPERNMKKYGHPAMFPLELPERCLKLFTYKNDVVLDPFMGMGTTGVACAELKRNFIGIEIDEDYFNKAKKRIEESLPIFEKGIISVH